MKTQRGHEDLVSLPVTAVMSRPVQAVTEGVLLGQVLTAMVRTGRRHLAVVDGEGRCLGVVGDRAVAAAWAADPNALASVRVRRLLDTRPSLVGVASTIGDVAQTMYVDAVDAVAVIDRSGCPVGMVTGSDLIALMATANVIPPVQADDEEPATDADVTPAGPAESDD